MILILKLRIVTGSFSDNTSIDVIRDWMREELHNADYMAYDSNGKPSGNLNVRVVDWSVEDDLPKV